MTDNINARQARAIEALLSTSTAREAAKNTGIPERTLYRWLAEPVFSMALREAERDTLQAAVRYLAGDLADNFELMRSIRDDTSCLAVVRLRAAVCLDEAHRRWREFTDIELRLAEVEMLVYGQSKA